MANKPLFTSRTVTTLRTIKQRAWLNTAVGGVTWTVKRWSGDGVTGTKTLSTIGTITGYVYRTKAAQLGSTASSTQVGQPGWHLSLLRGRVQDEDILISVADSSWAFTVRSEDDTWLFDGAIVEQTAAPVELSGTLDFSQSANSGYAILFL
jgi:hypothetical protein